MKRLDVMEVFGRLRTDEFVITNVGLGSRVLYKAGNSNLNLYRVNLPYPTSVGLGMALAHPEHRVIVLDGDGSFLAGVHVLPTIARYKPANLTVIVWNNDIWYVSTISGAEFPIATAYGTDIAEMGRAAGVKNSFNISTIQDFEEKLTSALHNPGPHLLVTKVEVDPVERTLTKVPISLTENALTFRRAAITLLDKQKDKTPPKS